MTTPPATRHRILVVDDDLRLRDLLKRYLTEQGFATDTVPDGAALDRALTRNRKNVDEKGERPVRLEAWLDQFAIEPVVEASAVDTTNAA